MGDGHCSINERCDLWALGRSQDRVNQSLCNDDVCNGSGDLSARQALRIRSLRAVVATSKLAWDIPRWASSSARLSTPIRYIA